MPHRIISRIGQYGPIQDAAVENGFPELRDLKHNGPNEATLIGAALVKRILAGEITPDISDPRGYVWRPVATPENCEGGLQKRGEIQ